MLAVPCMPSRRPRSGSRPATIHFLTLLQLLCLQCRICWRQPAAMGCLPTCASSTRPMKSGLDVWQCLASLGLLEWSSSWAGDYLSEFVVFWTQQIVALEL